MKVKIARLQAAALAVVMMAGMIAGCGSKADDQAAKSTDSAVVSTEASTAAVSTAAKLDEVTLKFYFCGEKKTEVDNVWNAVSEKAKAQLNAKFEVNFIPFADYPDKLTVLSASGDKYDANFDGNWLAYPKLVNKGAYLALNDLFPKYAPKTYETLKANGALAAATVKGDILCIPWEMSMNQARLFATWRGDLADKAGIKMDSIKTMEDFDTALHSAKKAYPDMKIMAWDPYDISQIENAYNNRDEIFNIDFHRFVIDINDPTCKIIPYEQTKGYRDAAKMAKKWYQDGIIPKNLMVDKEQITPAFTQGKVFSQFATHEWALNTTTFPDKSFVKSSALLYGDKKSANRSNLANAMAINKNAANPERALMFFELMSTDKSIYDLVMYGIEGKTYKLDGDKAVVADGVDAANSNYIDWQGQWGMWKPQFMRPTDMYPAGFWAKEGEFAKEGGSIANPLDGLFFDTTSIKNEIAKRDQINTELAKLLQYGTVGDVDKAIDDLIAKQKAAGLDKVVVELQKQVDAFLAK